jgi:hypothetical protein
MKSMKIFKNSFVKLLTLLILGTSCTDFVEPNIPYATFDTGAYLRTITRTSTSFSFFDLEKSKFDITVEAVDAQDGASVATVEVRVRRRRLVPGSGNVFIPAAGAGGAVVDVLVKTLNPADFTTNSDSRFLRSKIVVTGAEALTALKLSVADINTGDAFEFRLKLTDKSGRVFNDVNASGDVKGGAFFSSPFLYSVPVICPLSTTFATGQYKLVQTNTATDPFYGSATRFVEENITLAAVAGSETSSRRFTAKYLGGNFSGAFTLNFSCGQILKPAEGPGAGCAAGNPIIWQSNTANTGSYDLNNDSVLTVKFVDDINSSCAALANTPIVLTLTKI